LLKFISFTPFFVDLTGACTAPDESLQNDHTDYAAHLHPGCFCKAPARGPMSRAAFAATSARQPVVIVPIRPLQQPHNGKIASGDDARLEVVV
jgi:hypothetical protein